MNHIKSILPPTSCPIYVALSMGADSLAAAIYLKNCGYKVCLLHFNHRLRPQNEEMDKSFRSFLLENSFNSHIGYGNNLSDESSCRKARLEFFKQTIPSGGYLVTGHHLNDYIESYLLNCFRGQPEYRPMQLVSDFVSFKILHPFLLNEKKDMQEYLETYNNGGALKYVVKDETNEVIKGSRRNWIRNVIIPEMEDQKIGLKRYCKGLIIKDIEKMESAADIISP